MLGRLPQSNKDHRPTCSAVPYEGADWLGRFHKGFSNPGPRLASRRTGATLGPSRPKGPRETSQVWGCVPSTVDTKPPMKAAIVGAGAIAREHLGCLTRLEGVELVGVCDLSPALAEASAEEFGAPFWTTDYEALLAERSPDAVHITTPPQTHYPLAKLALEKGCHVFVEKPITFDPDELAQLFALAREKNRLLVEDHNYRFNRPVQRILEGIRDGSFGDVVHVDVALHLDILGPGSRYTDPNLPHPTLRLPGGAISDFLTHLAYLGHVFVGPHRDVQVAWDKRSADSPLPHDEFRALVQGERGTALLAFSAHGQPDTFQLTVHGTRRRVRASFFEPLFATEKIRGGPRPLMPVFNGLSQAQAHTFAALGGLWRKLSGSPMSYEGLYALIERFYAACARGEEAPISPRDIEDVHRLILDLVAGEAA